MAITGSQKSQQWMIGLLSVVMVGMLVQISKSIRVQADWSNEQSFTVSSGLQDLLLECQQQDRQVNITAFTAQQGRADAIERNQAVENLLLQLSRFSDNVQWSMVDFDADRNTALQMGVSGYGTIVVEVDDQRFDIPERNVFYKQIGGQGFQFVGEASITQGLRQVLYPSLKKAGVLSGVGGRNLYDTSGSGFSLLLQTMENAGYEIEKVNLLQGDGIPNDVDLILVLEPQVVLGLQTEQALMDYFQQGGQIWFASDVSPMILSDAFQVEWPEGVVAEPAALFPYWDYPIIDSGRMSQLAEMQDDLSVVFQRGGALIQASMNDGLVHTGLVQMSSKGWLERNQIDQQDTPVFDNGMDWKGAANLVVGIENGPHRSVLMRDVDWMQNGMVQQVAANQQLADSLLRWLSQSEPMNVNGRSLREPLLITQPQLSTIRLAVLLPMPVLILSLGLLSWWRREQR